VARRVTEWAAALPTAEFGRTSHGAPALGRLDD
jgi:hypothetical protein